eukprot:GHVS01002888.1.p2 GENE.GHVS01002888.1~~GHVS01002888.1.p2  ORF type:complete len:143 (+),score=22.40 GHVS01002888.1:130-558(+)
MVAGTAIRELSQGTTMAQLSFAALFLLGPIVTLLLFALPATAAGEIEQLVATQLGIKDGHAVFKPFIQCPEKIEIKYEKALHLRLTTASPPLGVCVVYEDDIDKESVMLPALVTSENVDDKTVDVVVIQTQRHRLVFTFGAG